jgi:hypothetical protein
MATNNANFNPTKLRGQLVNKLRMSLVVSSITNNRVEGEIEGPEDSVKILRPVASTVEDADGSKMSYDETLEAEDSVLSMDHQKRFGFLAKDIDNAAGAATAFEDETFQKILRAAQQYVLGFYDDGASANEVTYDKVGNSSDKQARIDALTEAIGDARTNLDNQEVPENNRWMVLPSDEANLIEDDLASRQTEFGDNVIRNRFQGMYKGFEIYKAPQSHFTTTGTSPEYRHAPYGHRSAITYADAIVNVETGRHSDYIADYVRGLHVAGATTLPGRDTALGDLRVKITA